MHHYVSQLDDNDRWRRFAFRPGDVVVATRHKCGTTWMQHIVLSMLHGTPDLPAPVSELSPWLDWQGDPEDVVFAALEAQPGRRVIKTHTPLDGLVIDLRAHFVVVVRSPLDAAVSHYHQRANLDLARVDAREPGDTTPRPWEKPQLPLPEWLERWISVDVDPRERRDSLAGLVYHASEAWMRQRSQPIVLVRYEDLIEDLEGQMRALADRLAIEVDPAAWPALIEGARFASMRSRADRSAPSLHGVLKDPTAFFRRGGPGAGAEQLSPEQVERYEHRVRYLVRSWVPASEADRIMTFLSVRPAAA